MNIDTSLLREKFIINEVMADQKDKPLSLICPSTRMPVNLQSGGLPTESYVIRTYNMHSCVRMVAHMITDYDNNGSIMGRKHKIDWAALWDKSVSSYEQRYSDNSWIAIYNKGNVVYYNGNYHKFFDVIEKCDVVNKGSYENSIKLAENSFAEAGTKIDLIYDSNIALIAILNKNGGRCSMVLRWPGSSNTFNYTIKPINNGQKFNVAQGLSSVADFLEGVQLAYKIGVNNEMLKQKLIGNYSDENKQAQDARKRIENLEVQIESMERRYDVRYRPERPDFALLIEVAENFAAENILNDNT